MTRSSRRRQTKSVCFVETVSYKMIRGLSYMSDEEVDSIWFTQDEYGTIQRDMKRCIQAMRMGLEENSSDHCYRGLEHLMSSKVLRERQDEKRRVDDAILAAQDISSSPHQLADVSARLTKSAVQRATIAGARDVVEASASSAQQQMDGYVCAHHSRQHQTRHLMRLQQILHQLQEKFHRSESNKAPR